MKTKLFWTVFFIIVLKSNLNAQHVAFIENKNQWESQVLYKTELYNGAIFFERTAITCVFLKEESLREFADLKSKKITEREVKTNFQAFPAAAYRLHFINSNPEAVLKEGNAFPDYHNYFQGNDPSKWASEVKRYEDIQYQSIYPNIDLRYFENDHFLKYEYVVRPGGAPDKILWRYEGVEKVYLKNEHLHIQTAVNKVMELKPFAYQIGVAGDTVKVDCRYHLNKNVLSFVCGDYNRDLDLIIDPVLIFSTYTGSRADNWGYTATYDHDGNFYAGGSVFGVNYPVTLGAFQINYAGGVGDNVSRMGGTDIAITKFNPTGTNLIYSTYLGGSYAEVPHSLVVNENNELYVLASTSSSNFPTTQGVYSQTFSKGTYYTLTGIPYLNGSDIAIVKFNSTGTQLLASTFIGGSGNDGLNTALKKNYADEVRGEIICDEQSNIYVVSSTHSTNFPTTSGAFQRTHGGGQDGCVFKMNYNLSNLIWSTFLGGKADDAAYSIVLGKNNDVYVGGGTTSSNYPVTPNALQTNFNLGLSSTLPDGFVSQLNPGGTALLNSTYLGRENYDQVYQVKNDRDGNIYVFGQTVSAGTAWVSNAAWYIANGGQFISKLNPSLSKFIWSTQFGRGLTGANLGPDISPTALMVDYCNGIYITGWGGTKVNSFGGTRGLPITGDAFQSATDDNDFYLMALKDDASGIIYGTYFGDSRSNSRSGEHVDGGTCRFDKKGTVYQAVCAGCGGENFFPTTMGVYSNTNGSSNCNLGAFKFNFNLPACVADFAAPNMVCAPANVSFANNSQIISSNSQYYWDFGDGTSSNLFSPTHTYTTSGQYTIMLVVLDGSSCNSQDTAFRTITVLSNSKDTLPDKGICTGENIQIGIPPSSNPNVRYSWTPATDLSNANISNPMASPSVTTTYTLSIFADVCVDTLIQKVEVENLTAVYSPLSVCKGDTVSLKIPASLPLTTVIWSSNPTLSDTLNANINTNLFKIVFDSDRILYYKVFSKYCSTMGMLKVSLSQLTDTIKPYYSLCEKDSIQLITTTPKSGYSYFWSSNCAAFSNPNSLNSFVKTADSCVVSLKITNDIGCSKQLNTLVYPTHLRTNTNSQNPTCYNRCDGKITLTPSHGATPYSVSWANDSTTMNISGLCAGTYIATLKDNDNCILNDTTILIKPDSIIITETRNDKINCIDSCFGHINTFTAGGTPPYQYRWINGQTTDSLINACAGYYTLTVTDSKNCTASRSFTVADTSLFDVRYKTDSVSCYGLCDGKGIITPSGGVLPYTYSWIGFSNYTGKDSVNVLCSKIYSIVVKEGSGCTKAIFLDIKQPDPIRLSNVEIKELVCRGDRNGSINFKINGGNGNYQIRVNNEIKQLPLENLGAGDYRIRITDPKNCSFDTVLNIPDKEPLTLNITATKNPCREVCLASAMVEASGGKPPYTYRWENGDTALTVYNLCNGTHSLKVTDSTLCTTETSVQIRDSVLFPYNITISASKDSVYRYERFKVYATYIPDYTYQWNPAKQFTTPDKDSSEVYLIDNDLFMVTVKDTFGCAKTASLRIPIKELICGEPFIYLPNAFTPNSDGKNDILYVRSNITQKVFLAIYNRLGEKVFETDDLEKGWDGTFKGKPCDPGVYYYYIEATCVDYSTYKSKGNITLIR